MARGSSSTWNVRVALCLVLAALLACAIEDAKPEEVCNDVGYSIASRTLDCTGDTELANRRYERYSKRYECLVRRPDREPIDEYYRCVVHVGSLSCADVKRFGDDLDRWLDGSPACPAFLRGGTLGTASPRADAGAEESDAAGLTEGGGAPDGD